MWWQCQYEHWAATRRVAQSPQTVFIIDSVIINALFHSLCRVTFTHIANWATPKQRKDFHSISPQINMFQWRTRLYLELAIKRFVCVYLNDNCLGCAHSFKQNWGAVSFAWSRFFNAMHYDCISPFICLTYTHVNVIIILFICSY